MSADHLPAVVPTSEIARLRARFRREMAQRIEADLLPYEGEWLTRGQLEARLLHNRKRARIHAFELLLVYALVVGAAFLMLQILQMFMGPA